MNVFVLGDLGKILSAIVKPFIDALMRLFEPLISAFVQAFVNIIEVIIEPIVFILLKIISAFVVPLLKLVMQVIAKLFFNFVAQTLKMITFAPQMLENKFLMTAIDNMQTVALVGLALAAAYYGFKNFFSYFGFETEEPWKIFMRVGVATLLIVAVPDLCKFFLKGYVLVETVIYGSFGLANGKDVNLDSLKNMGDGLFGGEIDILEMIIVEALFIVIIIKILTHFMKIAERYVAILVLVFFAPLTMACSVAKPLLAYTKGWIQMFVGNLCVQAIQVAGLSLMVVLTSSPPEGFAIRGFSEEVSVPLTKCILILGCLTIMDNAEKIAAIGGLGFGDMGLSGKSASDVKDNAKSIAKIAVGGAGKAAQMGKAMLKR